MKVTSSMIEGKPIVHVYLLCYNEESIIAKIIQYYSTFCSKIFILDNYSTDKSVEIAKSFSNVTIIPWKSADGYFDDRMHVKMKTETYKLYSRKDGKYTTEVADWIIACDMDEVLYHPHILDVLFCYQTKGISVPKVTGFNIVDENPIDSNKMLIEQYRYGVRAPMFDKRVVFSTNFDMQYSGGAHPLSTGFEHMKIIYGYKTSNEYPLALLHYKYIGMRFMDKAYEYIPRIDKKKNNIKIDQNGNYRGGASHYFNFVKKQHKQPPFLDKRLKLFTEDGRIKFEDFAPTTGEAGFEDYNKQQSDFSVENLNVFSDANNASAADYLRELSLFLERKERYREAFNVISEALSIRPNGHSIQHIFKRLEEKNRS